MKDCLVDRSVGAPSVLCPVNNPARSNDKEGDSGDVVGPFGTSRHCDGLVFNSEVWEIGEKQTGLLS